MSARTRWTIFNGRRERLSSNPAKTGVLPAHLVGSELENGLHSPVLDIDFPARLVPSATPGHFHLYFDGLELSWIRYVPLLEALGEAGVIEPGYAGASIARGGTFVRTPEFPKGVGPTLSGCDADYLSHPQPEDDIFGNPKPGGGY